MERDARICSNAAIIGITIFTSQKLDDFMFSLIAPVYDLFASILFQRQTRAMLLQLDNLSNKAILDIGGGTGRLAHLLQKRGGRVWLLDASKAMLRIAKHKLSEERIVFGDAASLPFPDGVFDVAIIANALHHFNNQADALEESCRVLSSGGTLAVVEFHQQHPFARALEHLERLMGEDSRFFTPERLQALLPTGMRHLKTVKISGYEFITMAQKL